MNNMLIYPVKKVYGEIKPPGDKSISHRAAIIGALAKGKSMISNFSFCDDCIHTINILKEMGVVVKRIKNDSIIIFGKGLYGLKQPKAILDAGDSATTLRLMLGVLSGQKFKSFITGSNRLLTRPMQRVIQPLKKLGADIKFNNGKFEIKGKNPLHSYVCMLNIPSAQVKSAVMFASLYSQGDVTIIEKHQTRDHTERLFGFFNIKIEKDNGKINIKSKEFFGKQIYIPSDISSAAFFIASAVLLKDSEIYIYDVGVNYTRSAFIGILNNMGAKINIKNKREKNNELIGDIHIKYSKEKLKGITVKKNIIPMLIDEIPILCVVACLAKGRTIIENVRELKYKESNRIHSIITELRKFGAKIYNKDNNIVINGIAKFRKAYCKSHNDHRVAMSLFIAGLLADGTTSISDFGCVNKSFPDFYLLMRKIMI